VRSATQKRVAASNAEIADGVKALGQMGALPQVRRSARYLDHE